jgi:hypothetical protein
LFAHAWCDLGAEQSDVVQEGGMGHRTHAVLEIEAVRVEAVMVLTMRRATVWGDPT